MLNGFERRHLGVYRLIVHVSLQRKTGSRIRGGPYLVGANSGHAPKETGHAPQEAACPKKRRAIVEKNTCGIKSGARPEKNGADPEKNRGTPRKTGLSGQSGREREIPEAQHEACVRHASSSAPASSSLRFDREERVPVKQIYYKHGNSAEGKYYPLSVTSCSVGHGHAYGTFKLKFAFHGTLERGIPSVAKSGTLVTALAWRGVNRRCPCYVMTS